MEQRLRRKITTLLRDTGYYLFQGVAFFPASSRDCLEISDTYCAFCRRCVDTTATGHLCRQVILGGAYQAFWAGEPYYFRCWCGLNSVVLPVAPNGRLIGGLELGGILYAEETYENLEKFVLQHVEARNRKAASMLQDYVQSIPRVSTMEVKGATEFLQEALFSYGINDTEDMRRRRARYMQQRRIGELMQTYSEERLTSREMPHLHVSILNAVHQQNRAHLMRLMDDLLCRLLIVTGQNPDKIKAHLYSLLATLVAELVTNEEWALDLTINRLNEAYAELEKHEDVADISYLAVQQLLLIAGMRPLGEPQNNPLVNKLMNWLKNHFQESVRLENAAYTIGTSIPNLTKLVKKETGYTFGTLLREIRLNEAKQLLVTTDLPTMVIAERCGFYDASHLTRQFKTDTGMTPGEYRKWRTLQQPNANK